MDGSDPVSNHGEHKSPNERRRQRFYETHGFSRARRGSSRRDPLRASDRTMNDHAEWKHDRHRGSLWGATASISALHRHVQEVSARLQREVQKLHKRELGSTSDAGDEVERERTRWRQDEAELLRTRHLIDQDLAALPTGTSTPSVTAGVTARRSQGPASGPQGGGRGVAVAGGARRDAGGERDEGLSGGLRIGSVKEGQQIARALLAGSQPLRTTAPPFRSPNANILPSCSSRRRAPRPTTHALRNAAWPRRQAAPAHRRLLAGATELWIR